MMAIALNHLVHFLQKRRISRGWAIAIVVGGAIVLLAGVLLLVIPAAVSQGRALVQQTPRLFDEIRRSRVYQVLDQHFGLEQVLRNAVSNASGLAQTGTSPVLGAIGGVVTAVTGAVTLGALVVLMLVFGSGLLASFLKQVDVDERRRWEHITARSYTSIGGYLGGLLVICGVNATLTTICLAVLQIPFFLPLGILSGFSSLVPYAGPLSVAVLVTLLTLLTSGAVKAGILVGYFMLYGQFEGNVLGPFVFRRTVHLDPLVTLLAILFLAEFMGIVGAVIAVPAVAIAQIVVRELLVERREQVSVRAREQGPTD